MKRTHARNGSAKKPAKDNSAAESKPVWIISGAVLVIAVFAGLAINQQPAAPRQASDVQQQPAASSPFRPTVPNKTAPPGPAPEGMVWIPGGEFSMGSTIETE